MRRIIFFFIVSLLLFQKVSGQTPLTLDVFPAAPNASALSKFGDVPVGLSNGIPSVNVPIYSYKRNGLNFNVSLDYHAGGIKVEEIASDVGIGWALNAGGVVSRTVRGLPDDLKQVGYFYSGNLQTFEHYADAAYSDNNLTGTDSLWMFYKNIKDSQSDVFNYSINGKSGKFIYGLDGSYVNIPQSKVKIQRILDPAMDNNYSLKGFIITDTDGTKYEFMKGDALYNAPMNIHQAYSYPTSWNLTKIVAPFNTDSISISYETYHTEYQLGLNESKYTWRTGAYNTSEPILKNSSYSFGDYNGTANRIKRVAFPDSTSMVFNYNSIARKDITAPGALKDVTIIGNGTSIGYRLFQSYGNNGAYSAGTVSPMYRLQLDSVAQFGGASQLLPYKFKYNGTMPSRLSTAQDHWGFYYGPRANSNTLIPYIRLSADSVLSGADRTPDSTYAKTGSLISIQYPTGGKTDFTFESNRGDSKLDFLDSENKVITLGNISEGNEKTFVINRALYQTGPITFNFNMTLWCPQTSTSCKYIYSVKSLDGLTTYASAEFGYSELNTVKKVTANIANGSYKLTWQYGSGPCTCNDNFGFQLSYNQLKTNTDRLAGGIRVKKVVENNGIDSSNDIIREYSYNKPDGSFSGTVSMAPLYHYDFTAYTTLPGYTITQPSNWYYRSSSAFHPLSAVNGSPVSYTIVTERQKNTSNAYLGKTVHEFTGYQDIGLVVCADDQGGNCPPFVHQPVKDYGLGLPRKVTVYDNNNIVLKKTTNSYNHIQSNNLYETANYRSFKFAITQQEFDSETNLQFKATDFYVHTGRMEKVTETVVDYPFAGDSVVRHTAFTYHPSYFNLQKYHTFDSKGQKTERRIYYPYDYTVGGPIGKLLTDNAIATVVSTEDWFTDINNVTTLKAADITEFANFNTTIVRPAKYSQLNSTQTLSLATIGAFNPAIVNRNATYFKEQLSYNRFSTKGAILEHQVKDGPKTSYLYSYKGQYPIAEIKFADYSAVESALGSSTITTFSNLSNPDKAAVDGFLAPLKIALPNAVITSYVYKPLTGVSSITDAKNMTTYYEYDDFIRLNNIKDHNGNIVKNYAYNYSNSQTVIPVTAHQSQKRSEPFIKNNCPSGQNGTSVTYTVEAGKYSSTISPADADAKAMNDIFINGQKNANLLGGCSVTVPPAVFHNVVKTGYGTKNNCAAGESSAQVAYIVPANTYSASTQVAADQLALDDIAANAQEHANRNGICVIGTAPTLHYNTALTIPSIRNNCATGLNGSPVNYTVPAGRYSSTVSIIEANKLAMAEIIANGQKNANDYGGCTTAPPGSFNFVVSTPVPSFFKVIFNFASNGGSNEYMIDGQDITLLTPGSGTGSVTIIDLGVQPSTYSFNLNGTVINGSGAVFNNVTFSGSVTLTAQRTSPYYYYSQQRSKQAKRVCPSGQTGTWVTYTVPAGAYTSLISLVDASQKAKDDADANAQSYANSNGGCAINMSINYNTPISSPTSIVIYNSTASLQQSYTVSGTGTLTDISPGLVTVMAIPTAVEGKTNFYSFGDYAPAVNSQYASFGPLTLSSGMTLSVTSNQVFKNTALTVTKIKNNCTVGQGGSAVSYTVPANTYSSIISQADADAQAQTDANFKAQNFANANGTCSVIYWNTEVSVSVTRNNCSFGQGTLPVTYTVPAGTYSASSRAAANQQAQNDLTANAQSYANTHGVCSIIYYSEVATRTLSRNNCPAGQNGGTATYTSAAGKHSSMISQIDANAKAQADLDANAQTWANNYGACTAPTIYYNSYKDVLKTKNNCPAGQISYPVTYFVMQNAYSSTISKADADAKAQADLDANAQNYANANGTCVLPPATISYSLPAKQYVVTITNVTTSASTTHTISGTGSLPERPSASYEIYIEPVVFDATNYVFTLGNSAPVTGEYASFGPVVLSGNVILTISLPAAVYYNVAMSVSKTRNNCAVGEVGTSVTYNVAANTYSSTVSQAAANALAQANLDANAQNYANTNGSCNPPVTYYSAARWINKIRNNCTVGQNGSTVTYTLVAGKHTSIISQADADAKAQADLDANAQTYANTNGTCTGGTVYWNTVQTSAALKKNNCPTGQTGGSTVFYNVLAHTYSSTISQADANAQAVADLNANAQNYANANGTCVSSTFSISYSIPTGTQYKITVTNNTTGTTLNYNTSGTTGTISGIPIGVGYISILELNGTVGYYYNLDGTMYGTSQSGQFVAVKSSSATFGPTGLSEVRVLTITEEEEY